MSPDTFPFRIHEKDKQKFMKLFGGLTAINIQNEKCIKNINDKMEQLTSKFTILINSYKIIYIRKLSNILPYFRN